MLWMPGKDTVVASYSFRYSYTVLSRKWKYNTWRASLSICCRELEKKWVINGTSLTLNNQTTGLDCSDHPEIMAVLHGNSMAWTRDLWGRHHVFKRLS